jgi:serine/threonine protein kinase
LSADEPIDPGMAGPRYEILKRVERAYLGDVFLVHDKKTSRHRLLKALWNANQESLVRFRREFEAARRLDHPNIVEPVDDGQLPDGRPFLVTEYVEGQRLDLLLCPGEPAPLGVTFEILRQLVAAVDFAHRRHVLHRNLAPANILIVDQFGRLRDTDTAPSVRILDFGLSKILDPVYKDAIPVTAEGDRPLLFPQYAAYEVLASPHVTADIRSEVFSIGVIAYELVTGRRPFDGSTYVELLLAHQRPVTPPQEHSRRVPRDLAKVILCCLAHDPRDRFADAGELHRALLAIERLIPVRSTPAKAAVVSLGLHDSPTAMLCQSPPVQEFFSCEYYRHAADAVLARGCTGSDLHVARQAVLETEFIADRQAERHKALADLLERATALLASRPREVGSRVAPASGLEQYVASLREEVDRAREARNRADDTHGAALGVLIDAVRDFATSGIPVSPEAAMLLDPLARK